MTKPCAYPGCKSDVSPHHSPHLIEAAYIEKVRTEAAAKAVSKERERIMKSVYMTLSDGKSSEPPEYFHSGQRLSPAAVRAIVEYQPTKSDDPEDG